jgi:hypothetical protein
VRSPRRTRRGQFALLGVIVLAVTILALVAQRPAEPAFAFERGAMQSAQLIHLARYCMATGCSDGKLRGLVDGLVAYNASEPLLLFPIASCSYRGIARAGRVENYTLFLVRTLGGVETVAVWVSAQSSPVQARYERVVRGEKLTFSNVTLTYCHVYASPFFPAPSGAPPCPLSQPLSGIVYCPRLHDPRGVAELTYVGYCVWRVSVPGNYTLVDEFGIPVKVVVRG